MPNKTAKISLFHRRVDTEILIDAPAERIWGILMDPPELAKWSSTFQGMRGELKKGGSVTADFMFMGRLLKPVHTLVAYEENRIFAWSDPIIPGLRDHHRYILEPVSATQTRFLQLDELRGPLVPLLGGWLIGQLFTLYQDFNAKLKISAEKAVSGKAAQD